MISENVSWRSVWAISKFVDPYDIISQLTRDGVSLEQIKKSFPSAFMGEEKIDGNIALNEGLQEVIDLFCGIGGTAFSNANARIGVGDSNAAESATQTGLQATSNKLYKGMDTGYPQRSGQTVTFQATFGPNDANFSWQEFTVANGSSDTAKNLNRKVQDKGIKASGETWVIQVSITFS